ncbi:DNA-(apurinic or apyrimidinic site) lyase [Lecanora helva]
MRDSIALAGKSRSSPRAQRTKKGATSAKAESLATPDQTQPTALVAAEELDSDSETGKKKKSPAKSRKSTKTKAATISEEQTSAEKTEDVDGVTEVKKGTDTVKKIRQPSPPKAASQSTPRKRKLGEVTEEIFDANENALQSPKRNRKTRTVKGTGSSTKTINRRKATIKEEDQSEGDSVPDEPKGKKRVKEEEQEPDDNGEPIKKVKKKRKTKEEKEAEAMPLAARTHGLRMYIGAHVSCAKGVQNSVTNCVHIGGNAFAMFLKSQRKWENPPLQDEHRDLFISHCSDHKYDASSHVLPHGSYLVNLAQEEAEKATQAYNAFIDDLHRCEALGIKLYNFHPGWTGSHPRPSAIARIAKALNRAHLATKTVTPVLETMAGGGNVIGSTFEDIRDIIALVDDKNRIGVCLDTCHVFAAGYDLRAPTAFKKTLDDFDNVIGIKYLRALHLNDSKAPFGSHRDLHQNIGLGFLGLRAFHNVMNEPRFEGLPMVLETPIDHKDTETGKDVEDKGVWAREIKMLESLIGMDADSDEFVALEKELAEKGAEERAKLQEQFDRKVEKEKKALEKGQTKLAFGKGKKKTKAKGGSEMSSDSEA